MAKTLLINGSTGGVPLQDNQAYAQSKLAITMWSSHLAQELGPARNAAVVATIETLLM